MNQKSEMMVILIMEMAVVMTVELKMDMHEVGDLYQEVILVHYVLLKENHLMMLKMLEKLFEGMDLNIVFLKNVMMETQIF